MYKIWKRYFQNPWFYYAGNASGRQMHLNSLIMMYCKVFPEKANLDWKNWHKCNEDFIPQEPSVTVKMDLHNKVVIILCNYYLPFIETVFETSFLYTNY